MPTRSETGRKVFVTNLGFHDFSKARRFGDIIPVTKGNIDLLHTDRLEAKIQTVLDTSDNEDYLLVSGHPLVVALSIGYWFRLHRTIRILYWDTMIGDYILRPTDFSPREAQIEALLNDEDREEIEFIG